MLRKSPAAGERLPDLPTQRDGLEQEIQTVAFTSELNGTEAADLLREGLQEGLAHVPEAATLHLLVIDDDLPVLRACCEIAAGIGFTVHPANSAERARELVRNSVVDVVLLDLKMPTGGLALLEDIRVQRPRAAIVVMTAFATVSSAVEAMRLGASDYLTKPFAMEELTGVLERAGQRRQFEMESRRLQERLQTQSGSGALIGNSDEMERLYRILSKVAFSAHPVLILGESGTGKEAVARTIHSSGPRTDKPFTLVQCSALAPAMLEGELFGYVRGAFAGANRNKEGALASTDGSTVMLEAIHDLSLDLQGKLLRALQEREFRPAGGTHPVPLTARLLASTDRDLATMVEQGTFRKDLFYRLNVVTLRIPPLRERRGDIALLAEHFLGRKRKEDGIRYRFATDAVRTLTDYEWPGNVRELESVVERACALASGPVLYVADLPSQFHHLFSGGTPPLLRIDHRVDPMNSGGVNAEPGNIQSRAPIVSIAEMERNAILSTIRQLNGDKLMAAKLLGIGKTTLYRKLKEYGILDI